MLRSSGFSPSLRSGAAALPEADKPLPRHDPNGWEYDAERRLVTFVGEVCTGVKGGTVQDIQVVYGCPERVVR
jgi:hypothetical protein